MQKISYRVGMAAAAVVFLMTGAAFAQTPDATPSPAPAPSAAPAPEPAAPAPPPATSAPAASTPAASAPAATTPTAAAPATTEPAKAASDAPSKKSSHKKMSHNGELDRSLRNGTVPARYRNSVPREYQQYIPFDRR